MPIPDFTQNSGSSDVTLSKVLLEADPGSDAITFKVYLLFTLSSRSEAERAAATLPGLAEAYDLAGEEDNWKGALSVKPDDSLRAVLTAKEVVSGRQGAVAGGGVLIQGTAELVEVKAALSKKARTVLARLVFRGQSSAMAAGLADNLGRSVGMTFERLQGVLDFTAKAPGLKVGMIAAAVLADGQQVVGRVMEVDGENVAIQESGNEHSVSADKVLSKFAFSDDADTQAALVDYADRCQRRGVPVSWNALVGVMTANMGNEDGASPGNGARVCLEDVEAAVAKVAGTGEREPGGEVVELPAPVKKGGRQPKASAMA